MRKIVIVIGIIFFLIGCAGTHRYQLENTKNITTQKPLLSNVSLDVSAEPIYHHKLGIHTYELAVKEAVEKQFQDSLQRSFEQGIVEKGGDTHILVTALDTSVFPIAGVIVDVRLFFRIQIFDKNMQLQKTTTIYGFGSSENGNIAMEKAVANAFLQLTPILEELFIRQ